MHGATSFVSGPSNWWPEFEIGFFKLIEQGKFQEADRMHARLGPYMAWFDGEFSTTGRFASQAAVIKASMEYVGLYGGRVRPPFRTLNEDEKHELWATMDRIGVRKAS
jgi:dihydrodipicolinate synthase/N-acetylneuraminate lyase